MTTLHQKVAEAAGTLAVPGVAVGVLHDGIEEYAYRGVTSIENPLPVDESTLFQFGSTGKTYTATAIMRLVDQGLVDLDATVRTYVPELRLADEDVASRATVLHLLNHSAGWDGDLFANTGDGDDALEKYVVKMADIKQVNPLGAVVSYNNASLSLAGRLIEKVTGKVYQEAMRELIFEPIGLKETWFFPNDIMTRRFAVGHNQAPDGKITVARPWWLPRSASPAGGMSSNARDQIAWARFHLSDGGDVLRASLLRRMQEPTIEMPGSAIGDAVGVGWMLKDVEGVRLVSHGGDTNGQHSSFDMVPSRGFAIACLTNCGPNGNQFNDQMLKWALETYLGVVEKEPSRLVLSDEELAPYVGRYETIASLCDVRAENGGLVLTAKTKPEFLKELGEDASEDDNPPFPLAIVAGAGDRYIVTDGPAKGMKGYFSRDASGAVDAVHVGGRLATRSS